jgi:hypothetical protein
LLTQVTEANPSFKDYEELGYAYLFLPVEILDWACLDGQCGPGGPTLAIGMVRHVGKRGAAGAATKALNLPAWRKVGVDMTHILERHVPGAKYSAGRSVFPSTMNEKGIMRAIREAYESSTMVAVQGTERILLQGHGRGLTIAMWFNKATNAIETAYPVLP